MAAPTVRGRDVPTWPGNCDSAQKSFLRQLGESTVDDFGCQLGRPRVEDNARRKRQRRRRREVGVGQGMRPGGIVGAPVERACEGGEQAVQLDGAGSDKASKRLQRPGSRRLSFGAVEPAECGAGMGCAEGDDMRKTGLRRHARAASPVIECAMTQSGSPPDWARIPLSANRNRSTIWSKPPAEAIVGIAM